jgi:hypothetical protein
MRDGSYRLILMAKRLNTRTPHRQAIRVRITGPIRTGVVGSPAYFAGRRPPRTPDDLVSTIAFNIDWGRRARSENGGLSGMERPAKSPARVD